MNSTSVIVDTLGNASAYLSTIPVSTGFKYTPISFIDNVTKLNAENLNTLTSSIGEIQGHIKDNDSIASTLSGYLNTIVSYLSVNEGHYHDLIVSTTENLTKEILQGDTIDDYINIKVIQAKNAESAASANVAHSLSSEAVVSISQINWTNKPEIAMRNLGILPFMYDNTSFRFVTSYDIQFDGDIFLEGSFNADTLNILSSLTFKDKSLIDTKTGNIALADKATKADEADRLSGKTKIMVDLTDQYYPDEALCGNGASYIPELVGELPVHRGGTGAVTAEGARANLGITAKNIGAISYMSKKSTTADTDAYKEILTMIDDIFINMEIGEVKVAKLSTVDGRVFDAFISRTVNEWGYAILAGYGSTNFKMITHYGKDDTHPSRSQWATEWSNICVPVVVDTLPTGAALDPYPEGTVFFQVMGS